jgi:hypothetical protein
VDIFNAPSEERGEEANYSADWNMQATGTASVVTLLPSAWQANRVYFAARAAVFLFISLLPSRHQELLLQLGGGGGGEGWFGVN